MQTRSRPATELTARGAATRQRIVDAATQEFAEHGIAGARVERIVAAARTNKAQLYDYFGNKDGLFDAIFRDSLERIVEVVPIDSSDLPDWAVRLYDEYLEQPSLIRLATWPASSVGPKVTSSRMPTDWTTASSLSSPTVKQRGRYVPATRSTSWHWSSACPWPGHRSATSTPRRPPSRRRSTTPVANSCARASNGRS